MDRFISQILGTISTADYLAGFFWALIGAILSLRIAANKRDKYSKSTPVAFSWRFMMLDNALRLFTGFLITLVAFRFAPEILKQDFSMFLALCVGAFNDRVAGLIAKIQSIARK